MAYSDPRKGAKFVDDNNLRPRDNSGGATHREMKHSTDWGQHGGTGPGGATGGGILQSTEPASDDQMTP